MIHMAVIYKPSDGFTCVATRVSARDREVKTRCERHGLIEYFHRRALASSRRIALLGDSRDSSFSTSTSNRSRDSTG